MWNDRQYYSKYSMIKNDLYFNKITKIFIYADSKWPCHFGQCWFEEKKTFSV